MIGIIVGGENNIKSACKEAKFAREWSKYLSSWPSIDEQMPARITGKKYCITLSYIEK
jgi:hypothetical protein